MIASKEKILNFLLNISDDTLYSIITTGLSINNIENIFIHNRNINTNLKEPNKSILDLIMNCALECQSKYSDGLILFFHLLKKHINKTKPFYKTIENTNLDINYKTIENIEEKRITFENLYNILNSKEFEHLPLNLKELLLEGLKNSDRNSKFICKESKNENYILSFKGGFIFDFLENNIFVNKTTLENTYMVLIDGFIESVSEIHFSLEKAAGKKDNILIFCRAASNDVIETIKTNQKRNAFNVGIVVVPFDEFNLNKLKDLSVISNSDIILSSKGDLISGLDYEKFNKVKKVFIEKNTITFEINDTEESSLRIKNHVYFLSEKFKENNLNLEMSKIFLNRLDSFNSNITLLEIPNSQTSLYEITASNLFLKKVSEIINSSLVEVDDIITSKSSLDYTQTKLQSLFKLLSNTTYVLVNNQ